MAGVVAGDAHRLSRIGNGNERPEARQEHGDIADAVAESFGVLREIGACEDEVIFVKPRPAARGVGDDGIHVGRERAEIPQRDLETCVRVLSQIRDRAGAVSLKGVQNGTEGRNGKGGPKAARLS